MYQNAYAEIMEDDQRSAQSREQELLDRAVTMLGSAERAGTGSREADEALSFVKRLWIVFIDDLKNPGNALPDDLKASLVSIGIYVLREVEGIRAGQSDDFRGIIEVLESLASPAARRETKWNHQSPGDEHEQEPERAVTTPAAYFSF